MTDKHENENIVAVKLDAERRREIHDIRERFENTWRELSIFQTEMKHSVQLISQKQDSLKERFEAGTAVTLKELRKDFSQFLTEWGKKQEQDKMRDEKIQVVSEKSDQVTNNLNWLVRALIVSVCSGVILAAVIYALQNFQG